MTTGGASAILSPDGQTLAFVAQKPGGAPQLYVRRLDQLQATFEKLAKEKGEAQVVLP